MPGQTFNVQASSEGMYDARGAIVDGILTAGPSDFTLSLESGGDTYTLVFESALLRFGIDATGLQFGVLAGEMSAENLIVTLMSSGSLTEDFLYAFSQNAGLDLHVEKRYGKSPHHYVEAAFKGVARALREAVAIDPRESGLPTVKGAL